MVKHKNADRVSNNPASFGMRGATVLTASRSNQSPDFGRAPVCVRGAVASSPALVNEDKGTIPSPGTEEFAEQCRKHDRRSFRYRLVKRAFDIAFSAVVVAVGFIPCVILAVAIAADTKGSPIYTQKRVGRLGRSFRIFKFRSMVADADNIEKYLDPEQLAEWRQERKVKNDPRTTKLGRLLRKTSIDELPQFLNVLAGQISVIGPRVISYDELGWYKFDDQLELLSVPQGITGLWQVTSRNEATFRSGERQNLELEYVRSAGFSADARVFAKTFGVMFGKRKTGR